MTPYVCATLEHENTRLKRLVADLTLDNQALKEPVGKKVCDQSVECARPLALA